jgi:hypothetical protein
VLVLVLVLVLVVLVVLVLVVLVVLVLVLVVLVAGRCWWQNPVVRCLANVQKCGRVRLHGWVLLAVSQWPPVLRHVPLETLDLKL